MSEPWKWKLLCLWEILERLLMLTVKWVRIPHSQCWSSNWYIYIYIYFYSGIIVRSYLRIWRFLCFACFKADSDIMWPSSVETKDVKWAATNSSPILLPDCGVLLWVIFLPSTLASPLFLTLMESDSKSQLPIQNTLKIVLKIRLSWYESWTHGPCSSVFSVGTSYVDSSDRG